MNIWVLSLICTAAMTAVGYVTYGLLNKSSLAAVVPADSRHMIKSAVAMYLISYMFIVLYNAIIFSSGVQGIVKGLFVGIMIGLTGFVLPYIIDSRWTSANPSAAKAVSLNWLATFIVVGLIVGAVLG